MSGEGATVMKKSKRVMRRSILQCLYTHLQDAYGLEIPSEEFVQGQISDHEIDAMLAFKSDPRIDELRSALDRLEAGAYGRCLACKDVLDRSLLDADPARRLCGSCERLYSHMLTHELGVPVSTMF
jgi:RNA polymerase-binding transcription factor DksA